MTGGRRDRGLYDGRNVSGARMWLEVGKTEDCMMGAMYREPCTLGVVFSLVTPLYIWTSSIK